MQTQALDGSSGMIVALITGTITAIAAAVSVDATVVDSVVLDFGPSEVISFPLWKKYFFTRMCAVTKVAYVAAWANYGFVEAC